MCEKSRGLFKSNVDSFFFIYSHFVKLSDNAVWMPKNIRRASKKRLSDCNPPPKKQRTACDFRLPAPKNALFLFGYKNV